MGEALGGFIDFGAEGALCQLFFHLTALQLSIPAGLTVVQLHEPSSMTDFAGS